MYLILIIIRNNFTRTFDDNNINELLSIILTPPPVYSEENFNFTVCN